MRVQIKPALRQVWRSAQTVQIGLEPRYATILDGLTVQDRALLTRLLEGVETRDVLPRTRPGPSGMLPFPSRRDREATLLGLLADAGVLVQNRAGRATLSRIGAARDRLAPDAATWSVVHGAEGGDGWEVLGARAHRWVEVVGGGRTGWAVASTLAAAGVGQVTVQDPTPVAPVDVAPAAARPQDVGVPREDAVRAALDDLAGSPQPRSRRTHHARWHDGLTEPEQDGDLPDVPALTGGRRSRRRPPREEDLRRPDVVVLVEHAVADAGAGQRLLAADVAHLSVVVREGTVVVGPFVVPGLAPCLRCLDLHRGERDPAWPRLLAQLLGSRVASVAQCPEETASSQLAASLAALQVLAHLDELHLRQGRRPAAHAATLEVELPDGLVSRREWPAHPSCGCSVLF